MEIITDKLKITFKSTIDFSKFNFASCQSADPGQISISQTVVLQPLNSDNCSSPPFPHLNDVSDSESDTESDREAIIEVINNAGSPPVPPNHPDHPDHPDHPNHPDHPDHPVFPDNPGQGNGPKPKPKKDK